ncbi:MAG: HIT family protein [Chloroflexi bacterium]|nr:HIT family protein [Chloroflexota bacterium]
MNVTGQTFGYPDTLIREYKYWVVLLRPAQITIGTLVLVNKSGATHLGQLSVEEWAEFALVSQDMESLLAKTFGAEKYNYLALMMRDPNVHFHFVPRYSKPVKFNGNEYPDVDWPLKTELNPLNISAEKHKHIKTTLLANLKEVSG